MEQEETKETSKENQMNIYQLDSHLDGRTINKRLQNAPKFKRPEIDYDKYPAD